jgi:hypothetical protein
VIKIPDLSVMQVKLQVGEIPAQKLKKDQRVEIVISSLDHPDFTGKITRVDKRAKPVKKGSRVKQVEVVVQIDSASANVVPGLSARVRIFVEERPDALVVPLDCVFKKDSTRVVYVKQARDFVIRDVKVVTQIVNFAVLDAEIDGGDQLALQEPQ